VPEKLEGWAVWGALIVLAASLFLPVGYGAEIFGVIYGWMFLSVLFPFCPLYLLPVAGVFCSRRMKGAAAVLAGLGFVGWGYLAVIGGFVIDAFLRDEKLFASGLLLGLASTAVLTFVFVRRAVTDRRAGRRSA